MVVFFLETAGGIGRRGSRAGWVALLVILLVVAELAREEAALAWTPRHEVCRGGAGGQITILQLSDLHLQASDATYADLVADAWRLDPDLMVFTGDTLDDSLGEERLARLLAALPARAVPYGVPGNWEHWAVVDGRRMDRIFRRHGGRYLVNEAVLVTVRGSRVLLLGLDDALGGDPDPDRAMAQAPPEWDGRNLLILAHAPIQREALMRSRPEGRLRPSGAGCEWMLSGHTHGGAVVLFGVPIVEAPGSGPYLRGWYREGLPMYVSRGIGNSIIPFRIGAPPEMPLFLWTLAGGS